MYDTDTCGEYDTADFVSAEACCACGGGTWIAGGPTSEVQPQEDEEDDHTVLIIILIVLAIIVILIIVIVVCCIVNKNKEIVQPPEEETPAPKKKPEFATSPDTHKKQGKPLVDPDEDAKFDADESEQVDANAEPARPDKQKVRLPSDRLNIVK